jgi:hypothetical protein
MGAGFISLLSTAGLRSRTARVPSNVTNDASPRVTTAAADYAGVVSAGVLRRRIRTASIRFSRTDSTRIE